MRTGAISCIERNAFAATRALDANLYASFSDGKHRVSFDKVVEAMRQTGHDLPSLYKETSEGGLAKLSINNNPEKNPMKRSFLMPFIALSLMTTSRRMALRRSSATLWPPRSLAH